MCRAKGNSWPWVLGSDIFLRLTWIQSATEVAAVALNAYDVISGSAFALWMETFSK